VIPVRTSTKDLSRLVADTAACFAFEGDRVPRGVGDEKLRRALAAEMKAERFEGRRRDVLMWNANGRPGCRRFLVIGLGRAEEVSPTVVGDGCARAVRAAERFAAKKLAIRLPSAAGDAPAAVVRAGVEGALLGAYRFERYLTDPARQRSSLHQPRGVARAASLGEISARAVYLARDLVNEPPSVMTPSEMTRRAREHAKRSGLSVKVLGPPELRRLGTGALLAVARGSSQPARVVHLVYRPPGRSSKTPKVVLVGKGVTFDSGGLNLKLGNNMFTMKGDMAGAAAVLSAMTALRDVGCRAEVHGLLGLVENMTGASAFKPGDILTTYSGKTVEVGNTDAEGRLVLCDLLAYASKRLKPDRLVDVATLTGACVVALGTLCSGVFSRHEELRDEVVAAGRTAGEKLWPMPMFEEYLDALQDGPADLKNIGERWGGAITAALFLGEFVPRELGAPAGGTGAGVRTLIRWLGDD